MNWSYLEKEIEKFFSGDFYINNIEGFFVLDKPKAWTSFDLVKKVRGILRKVLREKLLESEFFQNLSADLQKQELRKIKKLKVGHAGTLDPLATGLMILAFGKATKKMADLLGWDKEYEVEAQFGAKSDTYDADGEITKVVSAKDLKKLDKKEFLENLENIIQENFLGEIEQIPPKYSALKIGGKRACDLMREGKKVEIKSRKVQIYKFKILKESKKQFLQSDDWKLSFQIKCGSGTYVRSLVNDLGEKLKIFAYVKNLKRTKIIYNLVKSKLY